MYDSFLYGYGLTLFVFAKIKSSISELNPCKSYLDFNHFLIQFLSAENHRKILREFNNLFDQYDETNEAHEEARNFIKSDLSDIVDLGFERWVSKNLFDKEKAVPKVVQIYIYFLYNYWYHIIHRDILQQKRVKDEIDNIGMNVLNKISNNSKIFTTNFDPILDDILEPDHLHGRFIIPLDNIEHIKSHNINEKEFDYSYLFGTSGIEKVHRLKEFKRIKQNKYDLDFFYNSKLELGHLLIFGLSFAKAEMLSSEFLKESPQYENLYLAKSVDGHILLILNKMFEEKRLGQITISYFSDNELEYYKELFSHLSFHKSINYVKSSNFFFLKSFITNQLSR